MAYYLIDFENVKSDGLDGISKLAETDTVVIFYSKNAETMTFGLHRRLMETVAKVEYQKVETARKNALDFQLASYLGYLIRDVKNPEHEKFFIVTKDQGFTALSTYWIRRKVTVEISANISGNDSAKENEGIEDKVTQLVEDLEVAKDVAAIICKYKTKQGINNALTKKFKDGKQVKTIYSAIKPLLTEKK